MSPSCSGNCAKIGPMSCMKRSWDSGWTAISVVLARYFSWAGPWSPPLSGS
jgi:hypothetical protein